MAFNIYTSSDITSLKDKLAENIRLSNNVFIPDYLITTNSGINNWLKIQLAEKNKIASNLRFVKKDELIQIAYKVLEEKESQKEVLSESELAWLVYKELNKSDFKDKFPNIAKYYKNDVLKQYGLAEKIAKLLEDYQVYIPDELDENVSQNFQKYIWKQIKEQIKEEFLTICDVDSVIARLLKSSDKQELLKEKIPHIHIFLGEDITSHQIAVFEQLAAHVDVNYYFFYPFQKEKSKNKLVNNWATLLKNIPIDLEDSIEIPSTISSREQNETMLSKIQNDIYTNIESKRDIDSSLVKDGSIVINSCYTPIREVEVLYNYLIRTLDESNGELGARDILVQVTDMDVYASAINAIFSSANMKLPYSISDKSYAATDSVYNALEAIINVDNSFKAESLIKLLEFSVIRNKFNIEDIDLIRSIMNLSNIKFGKEGEKDFETETVSWLHGLKKLIYGFCIGGDEIYELDDDKGVLTDLVEGSDVFQLINLHFFVTKVIEWVENSENAKTMSEWHISIDNLVNDFIDSEQNNEINLLKTHLSELAEIDGYINDEVNFTVVREFVVGLLAKIQNRSNFATKGITFCSMTQMRNVPFKVVAVLGLNFDVFPRKERLLSYDLLKDKKFINRPSQKEQDKYLFLQILMSAKEKLYLSYIGKDSKTNSTKPPSLVVDDLCEYMVERVRNESGSGLKLITEHPMHGFSSRYNDEKESFLYSYLLSDENKVIEFEENEPTESKSDEIDLNDFVNFFKNPIKHFYNKQLGVYYNEEKEIIDDAELFEMDDLQRWSLKTELLKTKDEDMESFLFKKLERGDLPLKNVGRLCLKTLDKNIMDLKGSFIQTKAGHSERVIPVELEISDKILVGKIHDVYGDTYIFPCVSTSNSNFKYIIEFQIKRLVLSALGYELNSVFISIDEKNDNIVDYELIPKNEALEKLKMLYEFYTQGQQSILPFIAEYDKNFCGNICDAEDDLYKILKGKVFADPKWNFTSEYLKREFRSNFFDSEEVLIQLNANTEAILKNILEIKL